jgi:hypothetical protein
MYIFISSSSSEKLYSFWFKYFDIDGINNYLETGRVLGKATVGYSVGYTVDGGIYLAYLHTYYIPYELTLILPPLPTPSALVPIIHFPTCPCYLGR